MDNMTDNTTEAPRKSGRRLARADAEVVRANLASRGFYLQGPETVMDPLVEGGVGDG